MCEQHESKRRSFFSVIFKSSLTRKEFHSLMSKFDDLKSSVATLQADVTTLLSQPAGTSDADIQAVTDSVTAIDAQVKAALPAAPPAA